MTNSRETLKLCLKTIFTGLLLLVFLLASYPQEVRGQSAVLTIEPAKGRSAAAIKIKGARFQPGEAVEVIMQVGDIYHGLGTGTADQIIADKDGNFDVATGIPFGTPPGTYKVEAQGSRGGAAVFTLEVVR